MHTPSHWSSYPVPKRRSEAHFGNRVVNCFAERPRSFYAMFATAVATHPEREALVFEGRRWTWREAGSAVQRLAAGLRSSRIARGDRFALFVSNRPEFFFLLFAIQQLGAIAVPIGTREQRPGLAYMLNQCGAVAVAFDADLAERIPDTVEAPGLRLRFCVGGDLPGALPLAAIDGPPLADAAPVEEEDTAVILYTSGTTGNPKGAMLTHFNIAHSVLHFEACMGLSARDRSALAVPASHVTGLIAVIATMVRTGGATVVVPAFKAGSFVQLLAAERITHTLMVPAMYTLCLMQPAFGSLDLSHWRIGGYGGAPMPVATIDALATLVPGLTPLNAYGATETTSPVTLMPAGDTRDHADSVGVVLPCAEVRVMDDNGREVAAGESGELWIAGPMVVPGYWNNADATAREFTAGHWRSGDLGSVDAQGFVRVFDRKKDMLNRGGFKIYSVEVENVLMGMPGVVDAAVIGKPCPVLGERVHAFIHAPDAPAGALDIAAVQAFCASRLADYKVPESVTLSAEPLPRNANGKLLKRQLRDMR